MTNLLLKESEEDIQKYVDLISGLYPDSTMPTRHRVAVRRLLEALKADGRLLPPGGESREEFAVFVGKGRSLTLWSTAKNFDDSKRYLAQAKSEPKWTNNSRIMSRTVTSWAEDGPNDYWPKWYGPWTEVADKDS